MTQKTSILCCLNFILVCFQEMDKTTHILLCDFTFISTINDVINVQIKKMFYYKYVHNKIFLLFETTIKVSKNIFFAQP